jgi:hypothetical protein
MQPPTICAWRHAEFAAKLFLSGLGLGCRTAGTLHRDVRCSFHDVKQRPPTRFGGQAATIPESAPRVSEGWLEFGSMQRGFAQSMSRVSMTPRSLPDRRRPRIGGENSSVHLKHLNSSVSERNEMRRAAVWYLRDGLRKPFLANPRSASDLSNSLHYHP